MEKKRWVLVAVVLGWSLLLIYTFYYMFNFYNDVTSPITIPTGVDNQYIELYSLVNVDSNKLVDGQYLSVQSGDVIPVTVDNQDYTIKVYTKGDNGFDFVVNNFLYFNLNKSQTKRMDLDADNIYDLLITLDSLNEVNGIVFVKNIDEPVSVDEQFESAITNIQKNYDLQIKLLILIFLVMFLILVLYFIKSYLMPRLAFKKATARAKSSDAFDLLFDEFETAKRNKDISKTKRIYHKARHLYNYMLNSDKRRYKAKLFEMKRFVKG